MVLHRGTRNGAVAGLSVGILVVFVIWSISEPYFCVEATAGLTSFTGTQKYIHQRHRAFANAIIFAIVLLYTQASYRTHPEISQASKNRTDMSSQILTTTVGLYPCP